MKRGLLFLIGVLTTEAVMAQWQPQTSGTTARLRGVSAVTQTVAWSSGANGSCLKTTDGGSTWRAAAVTGAADLDFRDVDAFDASRAYLLSIGEGERSRIYKTTDGGANWTLQFTNRNPKAFFDAMAFWDAETGIAVSDPVEGRFLVIRTTDGGASWKETARTGMPPAIEGEAAFAASGTCITVQGKDRAWIGTGGGAARVFRTTDRGETWSVSPTPIFRDSSSSGIFSVAFRDQKRGIIVGGDYRKENEARNNVALTTDGGITWSLPAGPGPRGFRSAVSYAAGGSSIIAVGPSGSDYSVDGGRSWRSLGNDGFHALSLAAGRGWAVGEAGRIARFSGDVKQR